MGCGRGKGAGWAGAGSGKERAWSGKGAGRAGAGSEQTGIGKGAAWSGQPFQQAVGLGNESNESPVLLDNRCQCFGVQAITWTQLHRAAWVPVMALKAIGAGGPLSS